MIDIDLKAYYLCSQAVTKRIAHKKSGNILNDGKNIRDPIEDDSALVMHLQGKGLVVLSGCAHSGIINTIEYAIKITGIQKVHAVIGGFHLTGPAFEPIIGKTWRHSRRLLRFM